MDHLLPFNINVDDTRIKIVELDVAISEECEHRMGMLKKAVNNPVWTARDARSHATSAKDILVRFLGRELEDILSPQVSNREF